MKRRHGGASSSPLRSRVLLLSYSATGVLQFATAAKRLPIFIIFPIQIRAHALCASHCQSIGSTKRLAQRRKLFPALAHCLHLLSDGKVDCESRPFEFKISSRILPIHRARDLIGCESQSGNIPCPHLFYSHPRSTASGFALGVWMRYVPSIVRERSAASGY